MAKKKKTRKELLKEPDEFITFSGKLIQFGTTYKRYILGGLAGVFVIAIAFSAIRYFSNRAESEAFTLLEKSIKRYETIREDKGLETAYLDTKADFQRIIDKFPGKYGGKFAGFKFANICYAAGRFDEAIALYDQAFKDLGGNPPFKNLILSGLAYAHEAKKEYKKAIEYFERITDGSLNVMKDEALFNLGRLFAAMGNNEKSTNAFKKIVSDHTDSVYIELVKDRIAG
jgi:tetratricopeptide (TPR) repeat protein